MIPRTSLSAYQAFHPAGPELVQTSTKPETDAQEAPSAAYTAPSPDTISAEVQKLIDKGWFCINP